MKTMARNVLSCIFTLVFAILISASTAGAASATFEISGHAQGPEEGVTSSGKVGVDFFFDRWGGDHSIVQIDTEECWDAETVRDKLVTAIKEAEIAEIKSVEALDDPARIRVTFKDDSNFYNASCGTGDAGIRISAGVSFAFADEGVPDFASVIADFNDPADLGTTAGFRVAPGDESNVTGLVVVDSPTFNDTNGSLALTVNVSPEDDLAEIFLPTELSSTGFELLSFSVLLPDNAPIDTNITATLVIEDETFYDLGVFRVDIPGFFTQHVAFLPRDVILDGGMVYELYFGVESKTEPFSGTLFIDEISLIDIGPATPEELSKEIETLTKENAELKANIRRNLILALVIGLVIGIVIGLVVRPRKKIK